MISAPIECWDQLSTKIKTCGRAKWTILAAIGLPKRPG